VAEVVVHLAAAIQEELVVVVVLTKVHKQTLVALVAVAVETLYRL